MRRFRKEEESDTIVEEPIAEAAASPPPTKMFEGATPSGVLELPPNLTEDEAQAMIDEWLRAHGGEAPEIVMRPAAQPEPNEPVMDAAAAIDGMSDEEAETLAAEPVQMQLPMIELPLQGANIQVVPGPEEGSKMIVVGPVAIAFLLPLNEAGVAHVNKGLYGGIEVASVIPAGLKAVSS